MLTPALCVFLILAPTGRTQDEPMSVKVNPLSINTEADEDNPHVGANPNLLYFSSNANGKFDLCYTGRQSALHPWLKPQKFANLATEVDDRSVFFYPERTGFQYLFFATKKDKEGNNFDIYAAQRFDVKKPFSAPTPVQAVCTAADELHPWLTADGRSLYFSRKTPEGWRLFVATRPQARGPGGFTEPKPVAEFPVGFHNASITADGRKMYLEGPLDGDRWGLFVSNRTGNTWGTPEPLDLVNHPDGPTGDHSPCISRDGLTLYFSSDRPGGKGGLDLYSVDTKQPLMKKK
jgi:hypothetical protein